MNDERYFDHKQSKGLIFYPWMLIHDWANINRKKKKYIGQREIVVEFPDGDYKYSRHEIIPVNESMEIARVYLSKI